MTTITKQIPEQNLEIIQNRVTRANKAATKIGAVARTTVTPKRTRKAKAEVTA